jgi:Ca-activated chloride channel family protein
MSSSVLAQPAANRNSVALDSAARINAANALVREGKAAEAIEDYQQVPVTDADRDQLTYNLGVAEYREGNIDAAKMHFTEASASSQTSLAARSRYNLGNCFYSEAVSAIAKDKPAASDALFAEPSRSIKSDVAKQDIATAIDALRQAIGHYRGSLAADPNHTDARANIELAGQLLRELQEEQKQDQQNQERQKQDQQKQDQQEQDQQKQDQQEQDQQKQDQQKQDQQEQDQQEQDQQEQDQQEQDQQEQDQQEQDQQSGNQQRSSEQKQEAESQDSQDSKSGEPGSQGKESQQDKEPQQPSGEPQEQQPDKRTSKPEQESSANNPQSQPNKQPQTAEEQQPSEVADEKEEAEKKQAVPTGELTAASEQEAGEKPQSPFGMADPNADNGLMTKEEALKMLQAVRDRDMLRRLRQEQLQRSRHIPTDRDW